MTTPVLTRFSDDELAMIDALVEEGVGTSRSAVIRQGVHHLGRLGPSLSGSVRPSLRRTGRIRKPPMMTSFAMASAIARTEAEPW
ncbi:MAG: hypothetical protein IPG46_20195 [Actinobacteria bacterium]|nr:hypothetical protein [Actinomycetota bacterium]